MVTKIESGTDQFLANIDGETFLMDVDAKLVTAGVDHGIFGPGSAGGRTFRINGTIDAAQVGIAVQNNAGLDPDKIFIGTFATVEGNQSGIEITNGTTTIKNAGRIESSDGAARFAASEKVTLINVGTVQAGSDDAVSSVSDLTVIRNSGNIASEDAIAVRIGNAFDIVNTGAIFGATQGVQFDSNASTGRLVNEGTIGGDIGIFGTGDGVDGHHYEIINRGHIVGGIDFSGGDSNDLIDNTRGRVSGDLFGGGGQDKFLLHKGSVVSGEVFGGDGEDTYTIDNLNVEIREFAAAGSDTFRSFVSVDLNDFANIENVTLLGRKNNDAFGDDGENLLIGNAGNNRFSANGGEDRLRGGKGNDIYSLGDASDTLFFKTGDGRDVVLDFVTLGGADPDIIDLSGVKSVKNFNDLIENHTTQVGDDVLLDFGGGDQILLKERETDQLGNTHFAF